jgi:hypothetical protein
MITSLLYAFFTVVARRVALALHEETEEGSVDPPAATVAINISSH